MRCNEGDTWTWNGTSWTQMCATGTCGPSARTAGSMAYDAVSGRVVLFGGLATSEQSDTWEWDGSQWLEVLGSSPGAASSHMMTYDPVNRRIIALLRSTTTADVNETWEYYTRGGDCLDDTDCATGFCRDSVCCVTDGCGVCETCDGSDPGLCTTLTGAEDPDTCSGTSICDGSGNCLLKDGQPCGQQTTGAPGPNNGANSFCASGQCWDGACCDAACGTDCFACDLAGTEGTCTAVASGDDGACLAADSETCDAGTCVGDLGYACPGTFSCKSGTSCVDGVCKFTAGHRCSPNGPSTDCLSGNCADGYCCNSDCTTECFSCGFGDGGHVRGRRFRFRRYVSGSRPRDMREWHVPLYQRAECALGFCPDGVCCDSACTGTCMACGGGTCQPVIGAPDPGSCDGSDACDGAGVCKLAVSQACSLDTDCASGFCENSFCCDARCAGDCEVCSAALGADADGTCTTLADGASVSACNGFLCDGSDPECPAACLADGDCAASHFCDLGGGSSGACAAKKPVGTACGGNNECQAPGFCVDGFCCDLSCDNECVACAAALKTSGQNDGTCGPALAGSDPHDDCAADTVNECGLTGQCDGGGQCQFASPTKSCGATTCSGNDVLGSVCDGAGTCTTQPSGIPCDPYVCVSGSCTSPCASEADCLAGYYCQGGTCLDKTPNGTACTLDDSCESGFCADQRCCESACSGDCQSCANTAGVCNTVTSADDPDTCSGTETCDASGVCGLDNGQACAPDGPNAACASGQCRDGVCCASACTADCQSCNASGQCAPVSGDDGACVGPTETCVSGSCKLTNGQACSPDGANTACASGQCRDGVCCDFACSGACLDCGNATGTCTPVTSYGRSGHLRLRRWQHL